MASRTYIPTLRFLTQQIVKFVARYRTKINANLGSGQIALLDALLEAAQVLAASLGEPVIDE